MGKKIGITEGAVSNIEKGKRKVTDQMFKSICREFNVNEEWLRTGKGKMFNYSEDDSIIEKLSSEYKLEGFVKRLLKKYLELTEQQRNAVNSFLDRVYEEEFVIPQSSENTNDELSVTEEISLIEEEPEEFPPEYKNMSVEEIEKQADFWDSLYEKKRQAELRSQKQEENFKNMA